MEHFAINCIFSPAFLHKEQFTLQLHQFTALQENKLSLKLNEEVGTWMKNFEPIAKKFI